MSSSKFVGQLKQNNIQINNLKDSLSRTEKHMTDYETELSNEINSFMERQNFELKSHTEDIDNPHKVTKTQVGLDKVLNVEQASKTEFDLHASDIENPHNVTATQIGLSNVLNEKQATKVEFDDHVKNLSNPHSVTKEQIGLGNVTNVEQASKINFDNHASDKTIHVTEDDRNKWNTAEANANSYTDEHSSRKDNPHDVTKVQIGLGNVIDVEQATKTDLTNHINDTVKHISQSERETWNSKETPAGAQAKVDLLESKISKGTWNTVTLVNGAQQNSSFPFKFSVVNNVLWLRGTFGSLPSIGTVVARFTQKSTQLIDIVVPTIGSYGTARFAFTTDGELRFDGIQATDTTAVSRVSFNISIPLW